MVDGQHHCWDGDVGFAGGTQANFWVLAGLVVEGDTIGYIFRGHADVCFRPFHTFVINQVVLVEGKLLSPVGGGSKGLILEGGVVVGLTFQLGSNRRDLLDKSTRKLVERWPGSDRSAWWVGWHLRRAGLGRSELRLR